MSSIFSAVKAHNFKIHNIKEGHDVKPSVGDTFVNYVEAFKKTKTAEAKKNKNRKFKMLEKMRFHG
jgi:hypothetical protein